MSGHDATCDAGRRSGSGTRSRLTDTKGFPPRPTEGRSRPSGLASPPGHGRQASSTPTPYRYVCVSASSAPSTSSSTVPAPSPRPTVCWPRPWRTSPPSPSCSSAPWTEQPRTRPAPDRPDHPHHHRTGQRRPGRTMAGLRRRSLRPPARPRPPPSAAAHRSRPPGHRRRHRRRGHLAEHRNRSGLPLTPAVTRRRFGERLPHGSGESGNAGDVAGTVRVGSPDTLVACNLRQTCDAIYAQPQVVRAVRMFYIRRAAPDLGSAASVRSAG